MMQCKLRNLNCRAEISKSNNHKLPSGRPRLRPVPSSTPTMADPSRPRSSLANCLRSGNCYLNIYRLGGHLTQATYARPTTLLANSSYSSSPGLYYWPTNVQKAYLWLAETLIQHASSRAITALFSGEKLPCRYYYCYSSTGAHRQHNRFLTLRHQIFARMSSRMQCLGVSSWASYLPMP